MRFCEILENTNWIFCNFGRCGNWERCLSAPLRICMVRTYEFLLFKSLKESLNNPIQEFEYLCFPSEGNLQIPFDSQFGHALIMISSRMWLKMNFQKYLPLVPHCFQEPIFLFTILLFIFSFFFLTDELVGLSSGVIFLPVSPDGWKNQYFLSELLIVNSLLTIVNGLCRGLQRQRLKMCIAHNGNLHTLSPFLEIYSQNNFYSSTETTLITLLVWKIKTFQQSWSFFGCFQKIQTTCFTISVMLNSFHSVFLFYINSSQLKSYIIPPHHPKIPSNYHSTLWELINNSHQSSSLSRKALIITHKSFDLVLRTEPELRLQKFRRKISRKTTEKKRRQEDDRQKVDNFSPGRMKAKMGKRERVLRIESKRKEGREIFCVEEMSTKLSQNFAEFQHSAHHSLKVESSVQSLAGGVSVKYLFPLSIFINYLIIHQGCFHFTCMKVLCLKLNFSLIFGELGPNFTSPKIKKSPCMLSFYTDHYPEGCKSSFPPKIMAVSYVNKMPAARRGQCEWLIFQGGKVEDWLAEDICLSFQALVFVVVCGCLIDPPDFICFQLSHCNEELNQVIKTYAKFLLANKFALFGRQLSLLMLNGVFWIIVFTDDKSLTWEIYQFNMTFNVLRTNIPEVTNTLVILFYQTIHHSLILINQTALSTHFSSKTVNNKIFNQENHLEKIPYQVNKSFKNTFVALGLQISLWSLILWVSFIQMGSSLTVTKICSWWETTHQLWDQERQRRYLCNAFWWKSRFKEAEITSFFLFFLVMKSGPLPHFISFFFPPEIQTSISYDLIAVRPSALEPLSFVVLSPVESCAHFFQAQSFQPSQKLGYIFSKGNDNKNSWEKENMNLNLTLVINKANLRAKKEKCSKLEARRRNCQNYNLIFRSHPS
ncbi:hypothetical protein VP01_745g1 [Puccinia sorghi]|uniref:Uncharacterized protein n=1 Tax=Puccinia sorghi TaxID=27349 RepID=A0A0L6UEJ6_9BASI|nr:hypothetical protein VP01_745g1 [Puccinia sorghi]